MLRFFNITNSNKLLCIQNPLTLPLRRYTDITIPTANAATKFKSFKPLHHHQSTIQQQQQQQQQEQLQHNIPNTIIESNIPKLLSSNIEVPVIQQCTEVESWSLIPHRQIAQIFAPAEKIDIVYSKPPRPLLPKPVDVALNNDTSKSLQHGLLFNPKLISHVGYYFNSKQLFFKRGKVPLASVVPKVYSDTKQRIEIYQRSTVRTKYREKLKMKKTWQEKIKLKFWKIQLRLKKDPVKFFKPLWKPILKVVLFAYGGKLLFGATTGGRGKLMMMDSSTPTTINHSNADALLIGETPPSNTLVSAANQQHIISPQQNHHQQQEPLSIELHLETLHNLLNTEEVILHDRQDIDKLRTIIDNLQNKIAHLSTQQSDDETSSSKSKG